MGRGTSLEETRNARTHSLTQMVLTASSEGHVSVMARMGGSKPFKPTKQQLIEAAGKTLPDVIGPGLKVLFCGINPGLYTAAVGHHFARPGNRFWPALHQSGFTSRLVSPFDECELLKLGIGISNVVPHATA